MLKISNTLEEKFFAKSGDLESKVESEVVKGGVAAFAAGVFEFFGNWSTDFAMINAKNGIVDVPVGLTHSAVPVDLWMALSAASHFIALGTVAYSAYKLGNSTRMYREAAAKIKDAASRISKTWRAISKYAAPAGIATYLIFESVILASYLNERSVLSLGYDVGIWWNNAALAKIAFLFGVAAGFYARGKLAK